MPPNHSCSRVGCNDSYITTILSADIIFETDVHQIPSILEHNGGRGHLPILELTTEGVS